MAVRVLSVVMVDDVTSLMSPTDNERDAFLATLDLSLRPLVEGLARVRSSPCVTSHVTSRACYPCICEAWRRGAGRSMTRPPRDAVVHGGAAPVVQVRQLENALDAFQKRLVTRVENNEIKTFVSTVRRRCFWCLRLCSFLE